MLPRLDSREVSVFAGVDSANSTQASSTRCGKAGGRDTRDFVAGLGLLDVNSIPAGFPFALHRHGHRLRERRR